MNLFESEADWVGAELQQTPDKWLITLDRQDVAELDEAIRTLERLDKPITEIGQSDFPLTRLMPKIEHWLDRLRSGIGVVLVRGFPVESYTKDQAALAYWIIGQHMGAPASQNTDGDMLGHVRDTGADPADHNVRLYKTKVDLSFHTDGADLIGLMCLRAGKSGGESRIVSSVHVFNEVVRRRPDLAPLLLKPFHHHAHGQFGEDMKTFELPIVTVDGPVFRMFLLLWYIRNAAQDFPDSAGLSPEQVELLDLVEAITQEPGVALDMSFQPGDMQFLKNSVILHGRSEYEDWDEPERKRHLLRLWLSRPDFYDGDMILRGGVAKRVD